MVYDLSTEKGVSMARQRLEQLIAKGNPSVSITAHKKRTLPQNALLHCWIRILQEEFGYTNYEECKRDVVRASYGQYVHYNHLTKRNEYTDYETHKLTEKDMGNLLSLVKAWAADNHIFLPTAEEKGYYEMLDEYNQIDEENEKLD